MVPKEDRQGISTPRIPGAINPVMKNGYFEVITTGGIIDRKFRMEILENSMAPWILQTKSQPSFEMPPYFTMTITVTWEKLKI